MRDEARSMAILVTCRRVIDQWPVAARVAFREAVFANPSTFIDNPEYDPGVVKVAAAAFLLAWHRGDPWPVPEIVPDRTRHPAPDGIAALAVRTARWGLGLARRLD